MRLPAVLTIAALFLSTLACAVLGEAGSTTLDASEAIDPATEPVRVGLTIDESHAASAEIPVEGGTLTATGADGTRFTLTVPPGALLEPTNITMTPIASMEGLPTSGGLAAAVEFQPDGLTFYDVATLTIDLAESVPLEQQIPIGVSGAENNLELAFADVQSGSFRLQLLHFSSAGVAKGLLADLEPVRQRLGGDVEARLKSIAARELAYVRQRQLAGDENANLTPQFIEWYVQTFRENVLNPRLDAAEESCAAGRLALLTYVEFQRTLQLLGAPQALEGMSQLVVDLIPLIAKQCITEEYELCRDEHIIHRILPSILEIERQIQLLGLEGAAIDQAMAEGRDLAAKCLHFEIVFQSTATVVTPVSTQRSDVEARVPITLEWESDNRAVLRGEAALNNTSYDAGDLPGCTLTGVTGGGTFTIGSLSWNATLQDPTHELGVVNDMRLRYDPGETTESEDMSCPTGTGHMDNSVWSPVYSSMHSDEVSTDFSSAEGMGFGGAEELLATGWEILGGDIYATKEWSNSMGGGDRPGSFQEEGRFVLFHHPQ